MMKFAHCLWIALIIAFVAGCVASAQTVATIASSNVTAWAAKLHGSYVDLSTNDSYALKFYYGLSDGGTNAGSWDNSSSGITLAPTSTNDNYGAYSRTVIELVGTNTYYYRAMADGAADVWATQSLTFVTGQQAPTSTPTILYLSVTVDTNGVLLGPTNFFVANGVLPTSGVEQIFAWIASNDVVIADLLADKLDVDDATMAYFPFTGGNVSGGVTVSSNLVARQYLFVEGGTGSVWQTNALWFGRAYDGTYFIFPTDKPGTSTGHSLRVRGMASTLPGGKSGDLWIGGGSAYAGGRAGKVFLESDADGQANSLTNLSVVGAGTARVTRVDLGSQTRFYEEGANSKIEYSGYGSLIIMIAGQTQMVFTGSALLLNKEYMTMEAFSISATNGHSSFRSISGNANGSGGGITNIGLANIRIANSYTGGVMTLQTTDGATFFLK